MSRVRTITDVSRAMPPLGKQPRWIDGTFLPKDAWVREKGGVWDWKVVRWDPEPIEPSLTDDVRRVVAWLRRKFR